MGKTKKVSISKKTFPRTRHFIFQNAHPLQRKITSYNMPSNYNTTIPQGGLYMWF
jgi:hypothetical protein